MNFACKVTKKSQSMLIMPWDLKIIEILTILITSLPQHIV